MPITNVPVFLRNGDAGLLDLVRQTALREVDRVLHVVRRLDRDRGRG